MKTRNNFNARSPAFPFVYAAAQFTLDAALKVLSPRFHIVGRKYLPRRGAAILAPNHLSDMDPVLVGYAALRPLAFMAKRELFEIPFLGPVIQFAGAFPVERNTADRDALRAASVVLQKGQQLVIFPEGQCAPDGKLQPLLAGVALLALKNQVPVIPVRIINSQCLIPYGQVIPRPTLAEVKVHFMPALQMDDLYKLPSRQARRLFNERLATALQSA